MTIVARHFHPTKLNRVYIAYLLLLLTAETGIRMLAASVPKTPDLRCGTSQTSTSHAISYTRTVLRVTRLDDMCPVASPRLTTRRNVQSLCSTVKSLLNLVLLPSIGLSRDGSNCDGRPLRVTGLARKDPATRLRDEACFALHHPPASLKFVYFPCRTA